MESGCSAKLARVLMRRLPSTVVFAIFTGIGGLFVVPALIADHSTSFASLAVGTDDAFSVTGLEPRENQIGGGAIRWLRPQSTFRFKDVGPGPVDVTLEVRDHRTDLTLVANGAVVGGLRRGERTFVRRISLAGRDLEFGVETEGFETSTRALGTQFVSLSVTPAGPAAATAPSVPRRVWFSWGVVVLVAVAVSAMSRLSLAAALLPIAFFLLMILPAGLWRSAWLFECAALVSAGNAISALIAMRGRGTAASRSVLQAVLMTAVTAHGVLPPSPLVIQGDAQLHGNKLGEVARGNLFPTSRTDHKPPFEIPYGFSFYGLLSPFSGSGPVNVAVVRHGAAFFSSLSALALAALFARSSANLAAMAVLLWTFAPVNIKTMGFGNLSNVFAQAIFVLFLAGAGLLPKGALRAAILTTLIALSATAHLSAFIVAIVVLLATFVFSTDRHGPAFKPLLLGVILAGAYYATFLPMILSHVPRLLGERGGSSGVFDPWRLPRHLLDGAGWPLALLVVLAVLVAGIRLVLPLSRSLLFAGLALALIALVSPVEVRYLLALTPVVVMVAAMVFDDEAMRAYPPQKLTSLVDLPGLRRLGSEAVRLPLALLLLAAAVVYGLNLLLEFIPLRPV